MANRNWIILVVIILALLFLMKGCLQKEVEPASIGVKFYDEDGQLIGSMGDVGDKKFTIYPQATITVGGLTFNKVKWIEFFITITNTGTSQLSDVKVLSGSVAPAPPTGGQSFSTLISTFTKVRNLGTTQSAIWRSNSDAGCTAFPNTGCALDIDSYVVAGTPVDYTFSIIGEGRTQSAQVIQSVGNLLAKIQEDSSGDGLQVDLKLGFSALRFFAQESNYVDQRFPNQIFPPNNPLAIFTSDAVGVKKQAYFKFDLTAVPSGFSISSAKLNYKVDGGLTAPVLGELYSSAPTWDEDTINYNNRPAEEPKIVNLPNGAQDTWFVVDVKNYAITAFSTHKTPSFLYRLDAGVSETIQWTIYTEESLGNEPYLEITFTQ